MSLKGNFSFRSIKHKMRFNFPKSFILKFEVLWHHIGDDGERFVFRLFYVLINSRTIEYHAEP